MFNSLDVFILGAGKPALGKKPSALKNITLKTRALDWQIDSLQGLADNVRFFFLGGYQIKDVIDNYPNLNVISVPDWNIKDILHTLSFAEFSDNPALIIYSDTIFRHASIKKLVKTSYDIAFSYDRKWKQRYIPRSTNDINKAEVVRLSDFGYPDKASYEFSGLIFLKNDVSSSLITKKHLLDGKGLINFLRNLHSDGFSVQPQDVGGDWAEFNSPIDIAKFILGTKADTLKRLQPLVKNSSIGDQVCFTHQDWLKSSTTVLDLISESFHQKSLVIRSSSTGEDNWNTSNAGGFESFVNIPTHNLEQVHSCIDRVIKSYSENKSAHNQVLVQKYIADSIVSGVVMTCGLETGSPYYFINFNDKSSDTESVTSGKTDDLRTYVIFKDKISSLEEVEPNLYKLLIAVQEIEELLSFDKLDIEFAIDQDKIVHIFQVRPITVDHSKYEFEIKNFLNILEQGVQKFCSFKKSTSVIKGSKLVFGNMPDWNPAEIIGTNPRPLSFALYSEVITDYVWAIQRKEYGYKNIIGTPLMHSYCGQPYIDVRASLNSFIPSQLSSKLTEKLINYQLDKLIENSYLHDKIEFYIAFTVWTPSFRSDSVKELQLKGFTDEEIFELDSSLMEITHNAFQRLENDISSISKLDEERLRIQNSKITPLEKLFALIESVKHHGTLAFAHAARAGFVATAWLKSMEKEGIISSSVKESFMRSIHTVAKEFEFDKGTLSNTDSGRANLIEKYGHLRPGTYEVTEQAYWENPDFYLFTSARDNQKQDKDYFDLPKNTLEKINVHLKDMNIKIDAEKLFSFFRNSIEAREKTKFIFTKNISLALDECQKIAKDLSLSRDDISFSTIHDLMHLKEKKISKKKFLKNLMHRKKEFQQSQLIELPSLIASEKDFYNFEYQKTQPNFITSNKVQCYIEDLKSNPMMDLNGKIVMIPQADPGYDWLFSKNISGLITMYGGSNSHMAIRSAELDLPAAIGVGRKLYNQISKMKRVQLDCRNNLIREIF